MKDNKIKDLNLKKKIIIDMNYEVIIFLSRVKW